MECQKCNTVDGFGGASSKNVILSFAFWLRVLPNTRAFTHKSPTVLHFGPGRAKSAVLSFTLARVPLPRWWSPGGRVSHMSQSPRQSPGGRVGHMSLLDDQNQARRDPPRYLRFLVQLLPADDQKQARRDPASFRSPKCDSTTFLAPPNLAPTRAVKRFQKCNTVGLGIS